MENKLLNALSEAAQWENQMTEYEKSKITYFEARDTVLKRIYEKYNDIIKKTTIDECIDLNEVKELKNTASEITKQIQLAVGKMQVLKFHSPVCENVKYLINDFELDVMSISKSGMLYEFEVKVSRSDFLADKKKRKHQFYSMFPNKQPNYFSYACPKDLINLNEIGSNCGLYYFEDGEITEIRPPKRIHKLTLDRDKVLEKVCRITSERNFLNGCRMTYNNKKR